MNVASRKKGVANVAVALALASALAGRVSAQEEAPAAVVRKDNVPDADGRRTTPRIFANLGRNLVGVFSRESLVPLVVGGALTATSTTLDGNVKTYFSAERRAKWLGDTVEVEGRPEIIGSVGLALFVAGRLSRGQRFRDATYDIGEAMLADVIYVTALKSATHRLRPDGSNHQSFPSGHTSDAFACAAVAAHHYGPKLAVPAYILAGLIGVGRMEKNAHYLSDVMAGATLGTIVGRTVVREDSEPFNRGPRVSVQPARNARGSGLGVAVSVEF